MSFTAWIALLVILATVYALIKRYEARFVLLTGGLFLCCISLQPMDALNRFATVMTNSSLIMAICSSMGFAFVIAHTGCDQNLVTLLVKPLKKLGIFILPVATIITAFINLAIPSAAGCAAAVGTTFIPVMVRSGIRPAAAGMAILLGTYGSLLSPGTSHNPFVADLSGLQVMDFIFLHSPYSFVVLGIAAIGSCVVGILCRDNQATADEIKAYEDATGGNVEVTKVNILKALAPLVPLVLLLLGNTVVPAIKMGVAQAMVIGAVITLLICLVNPQQFTKEFFQGMGNAYGSVMGIIIAASVFAAGLESAGLVGAFVDLLRGSNEFARWGGSLGPFFMSVITGSGDAATMAFNQAVTPHAADFGMTIPNLGALAFISGCLGRTMSPIAGVVIVISGLSATAPIQLVKRTAVPMIIAVFVVALIMV
ncbi:MAG: C4-dicarboxylate transporter DcuC [Burkholderiales bacterium]|nr:C4-dicarboxylate transporter DcuC [Burkholderiales bacterium]